MQRVKAAHPSAKPLRMKKIQLSIPTPCHENWESMKPEDRGRFCGACQKTVIDFTTMSDRQLAEFFKKPAVSACGRFHSDQLDRAIEIPKKRILWVKYFFQVTWPAFVLLLKSCGQQTDVMGKALLQERVSKKNDEFPVATVGMVLPNITPVDSLPAKKQITPNAVKADVAPVNIESLTTLMGDTTAGEIRIDTLTKEGNAPLDTVNIVESNCRKNTIMGGLVATRIDVIKDGSISLTETPKQMIEALAYPNPINAGGQLTVSLKTNDDIIKQVQLFSSSGALVNLQPWSFKEKNLSVMIPSSLTTGVYFVRIVLGKNESVTVKIIVD